MKEKLKKNKTIIAYIHNLLLFGTVCWAEWKRRRDLECDRSMYTFRVIRTSFVTRQIERDFVCNEEYDIIGVWTNRAKSFHKHLKDGGHEQVLPNYTLDGWTYFSYEIQRRLSQNSDAKWKSFGYITPNCDFAEEREQEVEYQQDLERRHAEAERHEHYMNERCSKCNRYRFACSCY